MIDIKNLYNHTKAHRRAQEKKPVSSQLEKVPKTIKNTELFKQIKKTLLENINLYIGRKEKSHTKKIYIINVNYEMMNTISTHENLADDITTLIKVGSYLYAFQKMYEEVTEEPKMKNTWKEAITKKINKRKQEEQIKTNMMPTNYTIKHRSKLKNCVKNTAYIPTTMMRCKFWRIKSKNRLPYNVR